MNVEKCHKALLSLAQEFRTKSPPDLKSCMQCLQAILNLPVPQTVVAETNYQLGSLIYKHTFDTDIALRYLEQAYNQTQAPGSTQVRLRVVAPLVDIYLSNNQRQRAKQLLTRAINDTTQSADGHSTLYWHYRFLLKLSHLHLEDSDFANPNNLLTIGAQTAQAADDAFTRILFLLSKAMILMLARRYPNSIVQQPHHMNQVNLEQQLTKTLEEARDLLAVLPGDQTKIEALKVFFLVLQVCHHLNKGHNKSAKSWLTQLQQSLHNLTDASDPETPMVEDTNVVSRNMSDNFIWLPKDHMHVLVYLVSFLHSMQAGALDKASKYAERALIKIDHLRTPNPNILLDSFHIILLEHMSMCHLVMGSRVTAIRQTVEAMQLCYRASPKLRVKHRGVMRTLLGLYAMSMSMIEYAENHFRAILTDHDVSTEFRVMAMLNLALCYLQDDSRRFEMRQEVELLLSMVNPEQLNELSYYVKAAAYYVYGLKAFREDRVHDAKKNLRESLKMANEEDLNRVTSCSLVLLGKIFNNQEAPRDSMNMVSPAHRLAERIPDIHVQLWAASVLREIYSRDMNSQHHTEAVNMYTNINNRLNGDKIQAASMPEHGYIQWPGWSE